MRKQFLLFLVLMMAVLTALPVMAEETALSDDIVILYTNDVHTYIDRDISYDVIAGVKTYLETQYAHVLLVDAGDHIQGTAYGSMDNGESIIRMMNAAGYDLATLGNHEFDYTMAGRVRVTDEWAQYPYVSCNFYHEENGVRGDSVLPPYRLFTLGEQTLAIIGITTPETFTTSTPAYFQDGDGNYIYGISGGADGEALYRDVQAAIDDARAAGADTVIALGHLGDDEASRPWTSTDTVAHVAGLDAFIVGHSHATVESRTLSDRDGNPVVLTQTGEYFNAIGMMVIDSETGAITTELLGADHAILASAVPDADDAAIRDAWIAEVDAALDVRIGSAAVTFDNYDTNGNRIVRTQLTNTGAFAADALYYLFDNLGMQVDVAIMNGGGVRNTAITGELTYKTCKQIHTFGNVACLQTVTGQQILDALEWGARLAPDVQVGGFLHTAGLTYEIDPTVTSSVQSNDNSIWTGAPTGEYRVRNVRVYNRTADAFEPLDPTASYNLAGYNYTLRDLGDGFSMFDGAVNVLDYVMEDYMVLANYIKGFENGTITAKNSPLNAKYPGLSIDYSDVNGDGRITCTPQTEEIWDGRITVGGLTSDVWFSKYGNVYTDCPAEHFVNDLGLTWGDLVSVRFLDTELTLPVVPTYAYVSSGDAAVILGKTAEGHPTGYISLAVNMGNFAETFGLAHRVTGEDGTWRWEAAEGVSYPVGVTFALAEKEGYLAQYLQYDLTGSDDRADYPHLTDEAFANFREIRAPGIAPGTLFRTSSPINPALQRSSFADAALKAAGVTVIVNLADSADEAAAYPGFADSYYAEQNVVYLNLGVNGTDASFANGLAAGLRFMAENPGIYAVHCNEGKDRAGFVSALLSALCGATAEEITADYMQSYINYYGVEAGSDAYRRIAAANIEKTLCTVFGVDTLTAADLTAEAADYIRSIGLTDAELLALQANLRREAAATENEQPQIPESSEPDSEPDAVLPDEPLPEEPTEQLPQAPATSDSGIAVCLLAAAVLLVGSAVLRRRTARL